MNIQPNNSNNNNNNLTSQISLDFFNCFFNSLDNPSIIINKQELILFANQKFCNLIDESFENIQGQLFTTFDVYLANTDSFLQQYLQKSLVDEFVLLESCIKSNKNDYIPVELKINSFRYLEHELFNISILINSNNSIKKPNSHAVYLDVMQEQLHFTQTIMNSVANPLFYKDYDGVYLGCNKSFARLINKKTANIVGSTAFSLFSYELAEIFHKHDQEVMEENKISEYEIELPSIFSEHGRKTSWVIRKQGFKRLDGKRTGIVGIMFDITEIRQNEQMLIEAKNKLEEVAQIKQQFLENVSHEIRSPMNTIMGMSALLLDSEANEEQAEYINMITQACKELNKIIRNIFDFSKYDKPSFKLNHSDFSLRSLLEAVEGEHILKIEHKSLKFSITLMPDVPDLLVGDSLRLAQILNNLVDNAVKFSTKGEIKISVNVSANLEDQNIVCLRFNVFDQGIGIPQEKQHDIFEAFHQVDMSRTRKFGGVGLGLSISARLVELMGGIIWLESEVGHGTTVRFTAKFLISEFNKEILKKNELL